MNYTFSSLEIGSESKPFDQLRLQLFGSRLILNFRLRRFAQFSGKKLWKINAPLSYWNSRQGEHSTSTCSEIIIWSWWQVGSQYGLVLPKKVVTQNQQRTFICLDSGKSNENRKNYLLRQNQTKKPRFFVWPPVPSMSSLRSSHCIAKAILRPLEASPSVLEPVSYTKW